MPDPLRRIIYHGLGIGEDAMPHARPTQTTTYQGLEKSPCQTHPGGQSTGVWGERRGCHATPTQRITYRVMAIGEDNMPDPPRATTTRLWVQERTPYQTHQGGPFTR